MAAKALLLLTYSMTSYPTNQHLNLVEKPAIVSATKVHFSLSIKFNFDGTKLTLNLESKRSEEDIGTTERLGHLCRLKSVKIYFLK